MRMLVLAGLMSALAASAGAAELRLTGLDGRVRVLDDARLAALPRVEAKINPADVAPYRSLLEAEGLVSADDSPRGPGLAVVVVFRAADGYVVALPLADLYPEFRAGAVVVADRFAGEPLQPEEGDYRLVVEGEGRPARSAHSLVAVELVSVR